jgi:apolipoprotein N-acyltransferase
VKLSSNTITRAAMVGSSGLALAAAFPKFNINLLAWVAFVPLFYAIEGEPLRQVFGWAWLQGFVCYVFSLYWIEITLHRFAGVHEAIAMLPMLLLAAVVALYAAFAIWVAEFISRKRRISLVITAPVAWAAVEWIRSFFPIGFPWNLLGESAYRMLYLVQFAEFTGTYGVSALIMLFNVVLFVVLFRRETRRVQMLALSALTVLMVAAEGFGIWRVHQMDREPAKGSLRIAMVQGDIPQSIKWNPNYLDQSVKVYFDQTALAARQGVDLVVWPEAAAAFLFQPHDDYPAEFAGDAAYRKALLELARNMDVPILFGAPALGTEDGELGFYNRAYMVSALGKVAGYYDKIQLVPFGEYVPLKGVLGFFVRRVVHGFGDMFPGRTQTIFQVKGAKLGVLICYESVFPNLTRLAVKKGADILLNITNDAWYGRSSAPYQLLAMTAMRAIETKVPIVRVANTGISAVILPTGKITAPTPLFKRGTEIEDVKWRPERTVYTAFGDAFAEICFALMIAGLMFAVMWPRKLKPLEARVEEILSRNGKTARHAAVN